MVTVARTSLFSLATSPGRSARAARSRADAVISASEMVRAPATRDRMPGRQRRNRAARPEMPATGTAGIIRQLMAANATPKRRALTAGPDRQLAIKERARW